MPPEAQAVTAPAHWRLIDFISDLHLQASHPQTFRAWRHYMAHTPADAVFILGDLFEVWVGDDITRASDNPDGLFALQCQAVLENTSTRLPLYFMHGNRDFLLGQDFAKSSGMTLLPDPSVLDFDQQRWLLSHGDELCLDDKDYQQFRRQVRTSAWQQSFLTKPLSERQAIAHGLRAQSESRKSSGAFYADVDTRLTQQWLYKTETSTLIHGHTHRPGEHQLYPGQASPQHRIVLSDWDADAQPPRAEVLRLRAGQAPQRIAVTSGF
jgi:UDP-2,3-diacylglucosamine hydrolase